MYQDKDEHNFLPLLITIFFSFNSYVGMIYQTNFGTTGKEQNYCSHAFSIIQWQMSDSWKSDVIGTSP